MLIGPLMKMTQGNRYVTVSAHYFTKWPEAFPVRTYDADNVTRILTEDIVPRYGVPLEIHSDQGRTFESQVFKSMCETLGVRKTRTTPLHPQSNGMVERLNRSLKQYLSLFVDEHQDNWDTLILLFLLSYRSAVHTATSYTPAMLLMGWELRLPADITFGTPVLPSRETTRRVLYSDYSRHLRTKLNCVHDFARRHLHLSSESARTR